MIAFTFLILKDVIKYTFMTAVTLTYIDLGPGGDQLGTLVGAFEDLLLGIDWESLVTTVWEEFDSFVQSVAGTGDG